LKLTTLLGAAAIATLAVTATASAALAADNASDTPLYANSYTCDGAQPSAQTAANAEGHVNFHLDSATNTVTLNYHIKDGAADATYYVFGYDGACHYDAYLGSLVTNANGVANADYTYTIPAGATTVWTVAYTFAPSFIGVETPAVTP
jgi:hypothetical protein